MQQTTLANPIRFSGTGLHSGETVSCTLRPAPENTGIVFHIRSEQGLTSILPSPDAVSATCLATTLSGSGAHVSTVEHLLAALRGLGLDNVHVDVQGSEIPVLDGSAAAYVEKILETGLVRQNAGRRVLQLKGPVTLRDGDKTVKAVPHDGLVIDYTIDFAHPAIGRQNMRIALTPDSFARVAKARTFGFLHDVEAMRAHGLALGGSLENAIVLDEHGVMNEEGLRYANEFVRHKILDFIGDMAVLPFPLQGHFTVHCSGHSLNNRFARHIMENALVEEREDESYEPYRIHASKPVYPFHGGKAAPVLARRAVSA
jgi:UDP-3-0-acyl N-acetylglucosamine deacetylase